MHVISVFTLSTKPVEHLSYETSDRRRLVLQLSLSRVKRLYTGYIIDARISFIMCQLSLELSGTKYYYTVMVLYHNYC